MPTTITQTTNSVGPGPRVTLNPGDDLVVVPGVLVESTNAQDAVVGAASSHAVTVQGWVAASGATAIALGDGSANDTTNSVTIAQGGTVSGGYGVDLDARSSSLTNAGVIYGTTFGVQLGGLGAFHSTIVNDGDLYGGYHAIHVRLEATEEVRVTNNGTISTDLSDLASFAYVGGNNVDTFTNNGTVEGRIALNGGDDVFDNHGGIVTGGTVSGGGGDDRFVPGFGAETFFGGTGTDTLDFRTADGQFSSGVTMDLGGNNATSTGEAKNDSYTGIERVWGSETGGDDLDGDGLDNILKGFGGADGLSGGDGNDLLSGGDGDDLLSGGAGIDRLYGGANDDDFLYSVPTHGGDLIFDFTNGRGGNDGFYVDASGFGGGLTPGQLAASRFQVRADNVAQDSDDRFIFRTTDATLWYDAGGNRAGAPVLIADLNDTATMTSADIWVLA